MTQSVSADILTDPATNASYFLGRVTVGAPGIARLGQHKLTPGMPVEIVIKTGERTFFAYLMAPLLRRLARSAKEAKKKGQRQTVARHTIKKGRQRTSSTKRQTWRKASWRQE